MEGSPEISHQTYEFFVPQFGELLLVARFFPTFQPNPKKNLGKFASMPNIEFSFLYRDAANYKTFGSVVFSNSENIPLEEVGKIIQASCNQDGCFDPRLWGLPNILTQPYDPELDHDWYEFECVEETEEGLTDERSIMGFLDVVKANVLAGW